MGEDMIQVIDGDKNIQMGTVGIVNIYMRVKKHNLPNKENLQKQEITLREHLLDFIDNKLQEVGISHIEVLDMMNGLGHQFISFNNLTEWDLFTVAMHVEEYLSMDKELFSL